MFTLAKLMGDYNAVKTGKVGYLLRRLCGALRAIPAQKKKPVATKVDGQLCDNEFALPSPLLGGVTPSGCFLHRRGHLILGVMVHWGQTLVNRPLLYRGRAKGLYGVLRAGE